MHISRNRRLAKPARQGIWTAGAFFFSASTALSLALSGKKMPHIRPGGHALLFSSGVAPDAAPADEVGATTGAGGLGGSWPDAGSDSNWYKPVVRSTLRRSPVAVVGFSGSVPCLVTTTPPISSAVLAFTSKVADFA